MLRFCIFVSAQSHPELGEAEFLVECEADKNVDYRVEFGQKIVDDDIWFESQRNPVIVVEDQSVEEETCFAWQLREEKDDDSFFRFNPSFILNSIRGRIQWVEFCLTDCQILYGEEKRESTV